MTAWKNLHFRPPILKPEEPLTLSRFSDLILIRHSMVPNAVYVGYIIVRSFDDSFYHIAVPGRGEFKVVDSYYEWTEVPE